MNPLIKCRVMTHAASGARGLHRLVICMVRLGENSVNWTGTKMHGGALGAEEASPTKHPASSSPFPEEKGRKERERGQI